MLMWLACVHVLHYSLVMCASSSSLRDRHIPSHYQHHFQNRSFLHHFPLPSHLSSVSAGPLVAASTPQLLCTTLWCADGKRGRKEEGRERRREGGREGKDGGGREVGREGGQEGGRGRREGGEGGREGKSEVIVL